MFIAPPLKYHKALTVSVCENTAVSAGMLEMKPCRKQGSNQNGLILNKGIPPRIKLLLSVFVAQRSISTNLSGSYTQIVIYLYLTSFLSKGSGVVREP